MRVRQDQQQCVCVAPTPGQGISGGLYGADRVNGRIHRGVDLRVSIGEPIRALYSGVITKLVHEQPNRVNGEFPDTYPIDADRDAGGNRIRIYTSSGNFETSYMHLAPGNQLNLYYNKRINAGDIIGYGGVSGNSYPDSPVLHIQINRGKNYYDHFNPMIKIPYINATNEPCDSPNCLNR